MEVVSLLFLLLVGAALGIGFYRVLSAWAEAWVDRFTKTDRGTIFMAQFFAAVGFGASFLLFLIVARSTTGNGTGYPTNGNIVGALLGMGLVAGGGAGLLWGLVRAARAMP